MYNIFITCPGVVIREDTNEVLVMQERKTQVNLAISLSDLQSIIQCTTIG